MKVRPSVKKMCENCKIVRRRGVMRKLGQLDGLNIDVGLTLVFIYLVSQRYAVKAIAKK